MKGARPEQAALTKDTDLAKTNETRAVIEGMVDGLNDHRIDDIGQFFTSGFRWMGNQGCGTKIGLRAFQENWQRPFQAAFADKVCVDEARLFMGEWAAAFGRQKATHAGTFMDVAPTGKRITIRYMDFWKVEDGKITDNWVMVDFAHVLAQLGVDVFDGHGWEAFDRSAPTPEKPTGADPSGWTDSAEAWIACMGERGDNSREFVLDPALRPLLAASGARTALDVGCGEGRVCRMMAEMGIETIGLDPTTALLDRARERDPTGHYVRGKAEALPFADQSFDLVVTCLTLIDIEDSARAISEMARVLAPGGTLLAANLNSFITATPRGTNERNSGWITDDGLLRHFGIDDYLSPRASTAAWSGLRIVNHHRPLSHYMQAFLGAGLRLTHFDEPRHTGSGPKADKYNRVPYFNVMCWQKPS